MRVYKHRTVSTSRKTYADYLEARNKMLAKGITLKDQMDETAFEMYYKRLQLAKKMGEIKSGAWQTLLSKEKYISDKQAKKLAIAATQMNIEAGVNKKVTAMSVKKMTELEISDIGAYLNATKKQGLYGGKYE